jgi:hypothetical protein
MTISKANFEIVKKCLLIIKYRYHIIKIMIPGVFMNKYNIIALCYLVGGLVFFVSDSEASTGAASENLLGYGTVNASVMAYQEYMKNPGVRTHRPLDMVSNMLMDFSGNGKGKTKLAPGMSITEAQKRSAVTAAITAGADLTALLQPEGKSEEKQNKRTLTTVVRALISSLDVGNSLRQEAKEISVQTVHDMSIVVLASLASASLLKVDDGDALRVLREVFSSLGVMEEEQGKRVFAFLPRMIGGEYASRVKAEMQEKKWREQVTATWRLYKKPEQISFDAYSASNNRPFYLYVEEKPIDREKNKNKAVELLAKPGLDPLAAMILQVQYYKSLGFVCSTMVQLQDLIRFISNGQFVFESKEDLDKLAKLIDALPKAKANPLVFIGNPSNLDSSGALDTENKKAWEFIKPLVLPFATEEQARAQSEALGRVKVLAVAHTQAPIEDFATWLTANSAHLVQPGNTAAIYQKYIKRHRARVTKEIEFEEKLTKGAHAHGKAALTEIDGIKTQFATNFAFYAALGSQVGYRAVDYAARADAIRARLAGEIKAEESLIQLGTAHELEDLWQASGLIKNLQGSTDFGHDPGFTAAGYLDRALAIHARLKAETTAEDQLKVLESKEVSTLWHVNNFDRWLVEQGAALTSPPPYNAGSYKARADAARKKIEPRAAWRLIYDEKLVKLKDAHREEGLKAVQSFLAEISANAHLTHISDFLRARFVATRIEIEVDAENKLQGLRNDLDHGKLDRNDIIAFERWFDVNKSWLGNNPPYDAASYTARVQKIRAS